MSTRFGVLIPSLLVLVLGACADARNPVGVTPSLSAASGEGAEANAIAHVDMNAERASLLAASRAYSDASARSTILDFLPGMFDAEGTIITGGPAFPRGPEAIRRVLELNPLNAASSLSWTVLRTDVSGDGRAGYTYGYWSTTVGGSPSAIGKYIAFWRRQPDDTWKLAAFKRLVRADGPVAAEPPAGFRTPDYTHYRYFPNTDRAAEIEAVKATDLAFSALAMSGIGEAFAAYVADDGANVGNGAEFSFGREAVAANFAGSNPGELRWSPSIADVAPSGDLGFSVGLADVYRREPDGSFTFLGVGRYLTVWKKQRTGDWRFVIDG